MFFFFLGRAAEVVFGEAVAEEREGVLGSVDELEQVEVLGSDGAGIDEGLEVHDAMPVFTAVDDNENFLGKLVGLREREDFEEFVDGAEAAGKNHQRFGEIGEPEFAHEEIVEFEVERGRDVGVGILLEGQIDVEADAFASGFIGAEVGGFHDAGAAAGSDDETVAAGGDLNRPFGQQVRQAARVLVVAGHVDGSAGALQAGFDFLGGEFRFVFFDSGEIVLGGVALLESARSQRRRLCPESVRGENGRAVPDIRRGCEGCGRRDC